MEWIEGTQKNKAKIAVTSVSQDARTLAKQVFLSYLSSGEACQTLDSPLAPPPPRAQ